MHHRHQQPRHQQPRQHGDTLLEPPYPPPQAPPVYYYPPAPAPAPVVERRPSMVGAFVGGLLAGLLGFAGKLILLLAFLAAVVFGCSEWANHTLANLPDGTTTTTSAP